MCKISHLQLVSARPLPTEGGHTFRAKSRTERSVLEEACAQQCVIHPRRVRRGRVDLRQGEPGLHRILHAVTISVAMVGSAAGRREMTNTDTVRLAFEALC